MGPEKCVTNRRVLWSDLSDATAERLVIISTLPRRRGFYDSSILR